MSDAHVAPSHSSGEAAIELQAPAVVPGAHRAADRRLASERGPGHQRLVRAVRLGQVGHAGGAHPRGELEGPEGDGALGAQGEVGHGPVGGAVQAVEGGGQRGSGQAPGAACLDEEAVAVARQQNGLGHLDHASASAG